MNVVAATSIHQLPEIGEAWLVDEEGEVRAKFFDGFMIRHGRVYQGDDETTAGIFLSTNPGTQ